jgi:hypothetical protein
VLRLVVGTMLTATAVAATCTVPVMVLTVVTVVRRGELTPMLLVPTAPPCERRVRQGRVSVSVAAVE